MIRVLVFLLAAYARAQTTPLDYVIDTTSTGGAGIAYSPNEDDDTNYRVTNLLNPATSYYWKEPMFPGPQALWVSPITFTHTDSVEFSETLHLLSTKL